MNLHDLAAHQALRGIAIGRCVDGSAVKGRDGDIVGHAHISREPFRNWICLASLRHLNATTIRHELAHILSGEDAHNAAWARSVRELGGRVERRYQGGAHV